MMRQLPLGPCEECAAAGAQLHADGYEFFYCARNRCGGFFNGFMWVWIAPVDEKFFTDWLALTNNAQGVLAQNERGVAH